MNQNYLKNWSCINQNQVKAGVVYTKLGKILEMYTGKLGKKLEFYTPNLVKNLSCVHQNQVRNWRCIQQNKVKNVVLYTKTS